MTTREAVRFLRKRFILAGNKTVYVPTKAGYVMSAEVRSVVDWLVAHGWEVR